MEDVVTCNNNFEIFSRAMESFDFIRTHLQTQIIENPPLQVKDTARQMFMDMASGQVNDETVSFFNQAMSGGISNVPIPIDKVTPSPSYPESTSSAIIVRKVDGPSWKRKSLNKDSKAGISRKSKKTRLQALIEDSKWLPGPESMKRKSSYYANKSIRQILMNENLSDGDDEFQDKDAKEEYENVNLETKEEVTNLDIDNLTFEANGNILKPSDVRIEECTAMTNKYEKITPKDKQVLKTVVFNRHVTHNTPPKRTRGRPKGSKNLPKHRSKYESDMDSDEIDEAFVRIRNKATKLTDEEEMGIALRHMLSRSILKTVRDITGQSVSLDTNL